MNYLAFDAGGTSVKYGIVNENGDVSHKGSFKTSASLEAFYEDIETVFTRYKDIAGIAMSMPGAVACEEGVIYGSSAIDYIHGPNIKKDLESRLHVRVEMENDANCAALAEVWQGAAKGTKDSCFIVCGTGIGGAVVKDGQVHHGLHLHGGEFGYMIMDFDAAEERFDTWSKVGSTVSIVNQVAKTMNVDPETIDGRAIFDHEENPIFKEAIDQFYTTLAVGIYNLQYAYDPEVIVIGGGISQREDLVDQINQRLDVIFAHLPFAHVRPTVKKCLFANDANMIGATYHFMTRK